MNGIYEVRAKLKGSYLNSIQKKSDFPAVGDWVICEEYDGGMIVHSFLDRKSVLNRTSSGNRKEEQIIATNIDYVFIVINAENNTHVTSGLLERLLVIGWNSGAIPCIVLNKSDLNDDIESLVSQIEFLAPGVEVIITSAKTGAGINEIQSYLSFGKVGAFIGHSGVGKSSITNNLIGDEKQKTALLKRNSRKGRHTTSGTYMFELQEGGYIVDSAGLREIQTWQDKSGINDAFDEISEIANQCFYRDCTHQGEPGCAVQEQLELGYITPERYDSYLNLKKENEFLIRKTSERKGFVERKYNKEFTKNVKRMKSKKELQMTIY
jgi:ribosome biogenesis GTPase